MEKNRITENYYQTVTENRNEKIIDYTEYFGKSLGISIKSVIMVLCSISIFLVFLSMLSQTYRFFINGGEERYITELLNIDKEMNIPTFFSSFLLLTSSYIFLLIAATKKKMNDKFTYNWYSFSAVVMFIAMDEMLMLHEQLSTPIRNALHTQGFFYFAWLLPAIVLMLLFLALNVKLVLKLPYRFQIRFILSGSIYVLGAFIMEMIGGKFLSFYGQNNFGYTIVTTIEESLELSGMILLLHTLLLYIKNELPNLNIRLHE